MDINSLQLLKLERQRSSKPSWIAIDENISRLLDPITDTPVSVISIIGPSSKGKTILFANIASYLDSLERQDESWEASKFPIQETEGKDAFKDVPSIWSYHRHFVISNGSGRKQEELAVLLLYTHSFDSTNWEKENPDICALLGLTMAISTSTIVNVYKHLNEDCISALSVYLKYAVDGARHKSNDLRKLSAFPIQNMTIVIRDWNFPFEEDFHVRSSGHNFVKRKLETKQGQSRSSRQNRQIINGLVKNVSGWLLPFPGNDYIRQPYTNGEINEGNERFEYSLKSFVQQAVRADMLEEKTDVYGNVVNGRLLQDMITRYLKGVNSLRAKTLKPATLYKWMGKKLLVDSDEQEDCIPTALRTYSAVWSTKLKHFKFFDESTLTQIHEQALKKAELDFENEVNQVDEDDNDAEGYMNVRISKHILGLLHQRIEACYQTIREENKKRKLGVMNDMKHDAVQSFKNKISGLYRAETLGLEEGYVVNHSKDMIRTCVEGFQCKFTKEAGSFELHPKEAEIVCDLQKLLENEQKKVLEKLFPQKQ